MFTQENARAVIEAVRKIAKEEITPYFRSLDVSDIKSKSAPDDLVTRVDTATEKALSAAFRQILPQATIVGEEAISAEPSLISAIGEAEQCVIIDPIDGTWNYANGLATYGVIIAVVENGQTVFGLLYDPSFDDMVWAHKGGGAWFEYADGRKIPLRVEEPTLELGDLFGFVGMYLYDKENQHRIAAELPRFLRTLALRCSCHQYRMLAQGQSAFQLDAQLNPWDHAAGVLIYQEAGGVVRLLDGREYAPTLTEGRMLAAQSEELWQKLASVFSAVT